MVTATLAKNATSPLNKYADSLTSTYKEGPHAQEREVPALMLALVVTAVGVQFFHAHSTDTHADPCRLDGVVPQFEGPLLGQQRRRSFQEPSGDAQRAQGP